MCGRFALFAPASRIAEVFAVDGLAVPDLGPRYNIAPSQRVVAIVTGDDGAPAAVSLRWGLIPGWARDATIGSRLTNARSETVGSKPSFRAAFKRRRCLIPADGFYEWVRDGKQRLPYYIRARGPDPFAIAGLWERWTPPDGADPIHSCTLLTIGPNALMASIHDRMPVILPTDRWAAWLDRDLVDGDRLEAMLAPYPAHEMEAWRVPQRVNNARNQGPELIVPGSEGTDPT